MNYVFRIKQYFLLGILLLFLLLFWYFHLYDYCTINYFKQSHHLIREWMKSHYFFIVIAYIVILAFLIACTIPCATFLTLFGGFLFGKIAVVYAVFGITLGGTLLYLAVRMSIGQHVFLKKDGRLKKIERGFQQNAFNYLLMLRLVPIFPCWFSNIAAGILNVPIKIFLSATFLGIIPATLIYVLVGRGLKQIIDWQAEDILQLAFTPSIFFPLVGLGILSIVPVIYKTFSKAKALP